MEYAIFMLFTFNMQKQAYSMKRTILFLFIILSCGSMSGTDYSKIDKQAESVPKNLRSAEDIARYLTKNISTPTGKVRAIYYWISHNIRYDLSKLNSNATYTDPRELVDEVLKTRKGVCANYAALFHACCSAVGVKSYIIEGYTSQNGKLIPIPHAWNAVYMDGSYFDIDVTWAAGFVRGNAYVHQFRDSYFMIPPIDFIRSHMPFDPLWQFTKHPFTRKQFESGDFSSPGKEAAFNYSLLIKQLSELSTFESLENENKRIIAAGLSNAMIRDKVRQNQQGIATEKYNQAAGFFNKGVEKFNEYIQSKNKQFDNITMKDDKIMELLSSARQLIESAEQLIATKNQDNSDFTHSSDSMLKSIKNIKKNLDTEDVFMQKYIKTMKPARLLLFYKKNG